MKIAKNRKIRWKPQRTKQQKPLKNAKQKKILQPNIDTPHRKILIKEVSVSREKQDQTKPMCRYPQTILFFYHLYSSINLTYIYIIYIYSRSQTHCFVVSQHFSMARHAGRFKLNRNLLYFTLDWVCYRSANSVTYVNSPNLMHFVLAFVCLHFALSDTGTLNSLQYIYIYIYI